MNYLSTQKLISMSTLSNYSFTGSNIGFQQELKTYYTDFSTLSTEFSTDIR